MAVLLSDILSDLRLAISDESVSGVTQEFTDTQLDQFVALAVRDYSRYRPHIRKYTTTTVAQQEYYQLPTDSFRVRYVEWRLGVIAMPVYPLFNIPMNFPTEWQDPAMIHVRNNMRAQYSELSKTRWEEVSNPNSYMSGKWLRLYPMPISDGENILVHYEGQHTLNGNSYDTIPVEDQNYITRWSEALVLQRKARAMLQTPNIQPGQTRREADKIATQLRQEAASIIAEVVNALTGPVGARG